MLSIFTRQGFARLLAGLSLSLGSAWLTAADLKPALKSFERDSYKTILADYQGKPFLLGLWSLDCPPCFKELEELARWKQQYPQLNLVLIATDEYELKEEVNQQIKAFGLEQSDNWIFSEQATVKLRYAIDPNWHGELPRSYLYDAQHQSTAVSGLLNKETIQQWVNGQ